MSILKKTIFNSSPVQSALAASARILSSGKGTGVHNVDASPLIKFQSWLLALDGGTVVELGTRRTLDRPCTQRRSWVSPSSTYIASDFQPGEDVDVVADAEKLSETFQPDSIDAVIACSVFEHIRKPWLASEQIGKALKPGGYVYCQTHPSFPLHAYPYDYWRFSCEALDVLFSDENGFVDQMTWYEFPVSILSERVPESVAGQAFLNVNMLARKR